jgi:tartrate-resistant acid phosphatase type 5
MAQRKVAMAAAAFFALLAVASLLCAPAAAGLVRMEHPAKNDGSLSLLVVGDWGRKGTYNQSRVAYQVTTADNLLLLLTS